MKKLDKKQILKIISLILIIIWMIIVFNFSSHKGEKSSGISTKVTETIIQFITGNNIDENQILIQTVEKVVRKMAHYIIYTIGGMLIINYAYTTNKNIREKILYSTIFGIGYAITDEIHQFFVPGRSARIFDVGIDTLGVITGIAIYLVIRRFLKKDKLYRIVKRTFDIVLSIIAIIVLLPVFAIIALAIKLDSKGPILFKHTRIGKNGKIIKIYKFRTMVENAEDLIKEFTPEQMEEYQENYKLSNDPRITRFGKILRITSMDELPQLLNIIKGDLSIIGPRPVVAEELKKYGDNIGQFLSVTPGLTGFWATNGRSCINYEQRMRMELFYVKNISFKTDIKIFFKTIETVLRRKGAV